MRHSLVRSVPAIVALLLCMLAPACSGGSSAKPAQADVRVAAAASLKPVLPDLIAAFNKSNPAITITPTFGASGNFHAQLSSGAPFDLFLSADMQYPQKLADAGLTTAPPRGYAAGRLVLWTPRASGLEVNDLKILTDPRVKKLAIANPAHAPYGRAAVKALASAGLLDAVESKLVRGDSVEQAATFVRTGAAEVALLPKSQALSSPMKEEGSFTDVPDNLYEPIRHGAVVMKSSTDTAAADTFLVFLVGPEAQVILGDRGLAALKD